jgi:hypothetical protein
VADALAQADVTRVEAKLGERAGQLGDRRRIASAVVVQDDEHAGAGVPEVVERLVGKAAGECSVAVVGADPLNGGRRVGEAFEAQGRSHPVGVGQCRRGV